MQMICTARGEQYAHQTTMLILEQLRDYSWDAKAVIVLGAFALEYGKFWQLAHIPRDIKLGKSLAELNGLQSIMGNVQHLANFNSLVQKIEQVVKCITDWKKMITVEYNVKDVPSLTDTLHLIPVLAYWTISTSWSLVPATLISRVIIFGSSCCPSDSQDSRPSVYNGLTGPQAALGEFKNKHVLLFISGLDHIDNEIQLLKSIHVKLKEEPKELESYRKEDFKILWIPIVGVWDEEQKKKLDVTKVECPEGKVENSDAKQIISKWDIDGFPFRTSDQTRLTQQWNWFWNEMITLSPIIRELIKRDSYIFIYGGTNTKWIQDFTTAVEKLEKNETLTQEEETTIESYSLGRDNPKIVPRFRIAIDNLLASRKLTKRGGEQVQDSTTREIQKLMFLKQDPLGWAILTKGSHVKLLGHGDAMLKTVSDFYAWKGTLNNEVGFDVAFKDYYEKFKFKSVPHKCEHREFANYPADILAHIPCPNKCGHEMEVSSVKYMCCLGRETSDIAQDKCMKQLLHAQRFHFMHETSLSLV
ncbi:Protein SIEVE ELEMENT OCCLUSION B [Glycine max]|nr:Protein SIEVE ELEMENT OCCLUSION B [Glycine max]